MVSTDKLVSILIERNVFELQGSIAPELGTTSAGIARILHHPYCSFALLSSIRELSEIEKMDI